MVSLRLEEDADPKQRGLRRIRDGCNRFCGIIVRMVSNVVDGAPAPVFDQIRLTCYLSQAAALALP